MAIGADAGRDGSPPPDEKLAEPSLGVTQAGKPRKKERMPECYAREREKQKKHLWELTGGAKTPSAAVVANMLATFPALKQSKKPGQLFKNWLGEGKPKDLKR
eukprot:gene4670-4419_t